MCSLGILELSCWADRAAVFLIAEFPPKSCTLTLLSPQDCASSQSCAPSHMDVLHPLQLCSLLMAVLPHTQLCSLLMVVPSVPQLSFLLLAMLPHTLLCSLWEYSPW